MKIPFNKPPFVGPEYDYVRQAVESGRICGDGQFNQKCHAWLQQKTGVARALLTTSCSHALEMSALICNIQPGDEVIMPSFTFVSTADAFAMRGAKCVFVDIRLDTIDAIAKGYSSNPASSMHFCAKALASSSFSG
jgi:dTDP-4-amino-4,6-dideoxygalactose transaminase